MVRSQDRAGFVVNALLVPCLLSAARMAESGFATAADIDAGMELGCAHPMGPLLAHLIGLDTVAAIAQSLYDEFKEPLYAPPPLLQRMVQAGLQEQPRVPHLRPGLRGPGSAVVGVVLRSCCGERGAGRSE